MACLIQITDVKINDSKLHITPGSQRVLNASFPHKCNIHRNSWKVKLLSLVLVKTPKQDTYYLQDFSMLKQKSAPQNSRLHEMTHPSQRKIKDFSTPQIEDYGISSTDIHLTTPPCKCICICILMQRILHTCLKSFENIVASRTTYIKPIGD